MLEGMDAGSRSLERNLVPGEKPGPWCLTLTGTGWDAAEHSRHPYAAWTAVSTPRACNGHPTGMQWVPSLHQQQSHGKGETRPCHLLSLPQVAASWGTAGPLAAPVLQVDKFCPRTRDVPGSVWHGRCPRHLAETPMGLEGAQHWEAKAPWSSWRCQASQGFPQVLSHPAPEQAGTQPRTRPCPLGDMATGRAKLP